MLGDDVIPRTVVVGGGMAAVRLVEELVGRGVRQGITLIGDEKHLPYNRILLSAVLEGTHRPGALTLRTREWYEANGVELVLGNRVEDLDRAARTVRLVDGSTISYDRLVLATGADPIAPPARGPSVHTFRSLDDCARLLDALPTARHAVVVGGGLLGLQIARALSVRGLDTEVVESGTHLLHRQVDEHAGQVLRRSLVKLGTTVRTGVCADDDRVPDADLVVLATGSRPSTALAGRAGLTVRRGIMVNDQLTSVDDPAISAIGDCAEHAGRVTGFVSPAWEQARLLAAHLTGTSVAYTGGSSVARLRATGLDVAVLGDLDERGEAVEVSNAIKGTHRRLVMRDGRIVAATMIGDLSDVGLVTQHFDRGTRLGAGEAGALLMPPRSPASVALPDDAEICACAGVTAGTLRACSSFDVARETTRATTGCGGCADTVQALVAGRSPA